MYNRILNIGYLQTYKSRIIVTPPSLRALLPIWSTQPVIWVGWISALALVLMSDSGVVVGCRGLPSSPRSLDASLPCREAGDAFLPRRCCTPSPVLPPSPRSVESSTGWVKYSGAVLEPHSWCTWLQPPDVDRRNPPPSSREIDDPSRVAHARSFRGHRLLFARWGSGTDWDSCDSGSSFMTKLRSPPPKGGGTGDPSWMAHA